MKNLVLISAIVFSLTGAPVRAGDVVTLTDSPEASGKLTLNPGAIHVDGTSSVDVNLPDILEADFSDAPFQLNYFSSVGDASTQLPAGWKGQDVGLFNPPGTALYANGTLTLTGGGQDADRKMEVFSFVGMPWTTDGQWTARVSQIDDADPVTEVGLMLREGLTPDAAQVALGASANIKEKQQLSVPSVMFHTNAAAAGKHGGGQGGHQMPLTIQLPIWLRLTQSGGNVDASLSTDGKDWEFVSEHPLKAWAGAWAGFFLSSRKSGMPGKATLDQISFTPPPSVAQVLPPGVLLRSGTFLSGTLNTLDLDPAKPDGNGGFSRDGKLVNLSRSKVAAIMMQPTLRTDIAAMGTQVGVVMKNGDFLAGTPASISSAGVQINSVVLGIASYKPTQVRACVLNPAQSQPAPYEVRLTDGSIVHASGISISGGRVVINDISGITVTADLAEVAQLRAGSAQVQNLLELPWKATPPPAPAAPAPAPAAHPPAGPTDAPATNAAVAANPPANAAPAANPVPDVAATPAQCWQGNNEEQIMMASAGTQVDFPLTGHFRALALRIALSPDAPPNSQATVHILADGREIGRTPPFRAGDLPRYVEMPLQNPQTLSLVADSMFAGTKVLFIDPVAIRGN